MFGLSFNALKLKISRMSMFINCTIIIFSFSILLYAYSTGITGVTKKSTNPGCTCHGLSPSSSVNVSINGPDSLTVNQTANYSITISGGPLYAAGTDIAVSNGILTPASGDLMLQNDELTHVSPKAPVSDAVTFNFTYTAPSTSGIQTIYANGNSVNYNGLNTGDQWNFAPNKIIKVSSITTGIESEANIFTYNLKQNYPNPFNPTTKINYSIPDEELVTIKIYNLVGKEITTLINEMKPYGNYEIEFNATGLPSGVYFYQLVAGDFIQTKKMLLLK